MAGAPDAPEFCDFCGKPLGPSDFKEGQAVRVLDRNYCPACKETAIRRAKAEGGDSPPRGARSGRAKRERPPKPPQPRERSGDSGD